RRRHTRFSRDWSSDVCSSDLTVTLDNVATLRGGMTVGSNGLIVPRDGWYTITGSVRWGSSNVGTRQMRLYNNNVIMVSDAINARSEDRSVGKECRIT